MIKKPISTTREFFIFFQIFILIATACFFLFDIDSYENIQMIHITFIIILFTINFAACNIFSKVTTATALFWFSVSFMIFHILPIYFYNFIDLSKYTIKESDLIKPLLLSIIGFQSAFIGYCLTRAKNKRIVVNKIWSSKKMFFSLIIVGICSIIFQNVYPSVIFSRYETIFLIFVSMIFFAKYNRINKINKKYKYAVIATFALCLVFILMNTTGRRDVIKLIIAFSLIWSIYEKPFKVSSIFFGGIFIFIMVMGLAFYRTTFSFEELSKAMQTVIGNKELLLLSISSLMDFMPGHNNYEYIVNNTNTFDEYLWGSSLLKIILIFVPRFIWSQKPFGVQELIVEHHRNAFVGGSSQTTTIIGEFHWNFGMLGVVIFMYFFGYICKKIDINNKIYPNNHWRIILNVVFISWFIEMFRGGLSTILIVNSLQMLFPIILVWLIYKIVFINNSIRRRIFS